ncbi:MAG: acyltransferase family protein [Janthinobacterium lividum]
MQIDQIMITNITQPIRAVSSDTQVTRSHLNYLDGLRGLAALFVVLHHVYFEATLSTAFSIFPPLPQWTSPLQFGRIAVDIFIVLSGYCLMLPVVRDGILRGGLWQFALRRGRRILPPYWAALLLSMAALSLPPLRSLPKDIWTLGIRDGWSTGAIVSHLLLLHNLKNQWIFRIDSPMWSVATEWQIYFVFVLLLLPLWRRWGLSFSIAAACILGCAPHYLLHGRFDVAAPQFLALFSFGMAAATSNIRPIAFKIAAAFFALAYCFWIRQLSPESIPMDILAGITTACLIAALRDYKSVFILSSKVCVRLGAFSYSLYLVHFPVLLAASSILLPIHLNRWQFFVRLMLLGVPASLAISYLFHLVFERPFMNSKPGVKIKTEAQAEIAAIESPAP